MRKSFSKLRLDEMLNYFSKRSNEKNIDYYKFSNNILIKKDKKTKRNIALILFSTNDIRKTDLIEDVKNLKNYKIEDIFGVYYKDHEHFFRRLGDIKPDYYKKINSLKKYHDRGIIEKIVKLRDLEKLHLLNWNLEELTKSFSPEYFKEPDKRNWLVYYQPKTKTMKEGLKLFVTEPAYLDYSYLYRDPEVPEYKKRNAKSHYSKEEFILYKKGYI
jgi:hypothetical protein